MPSPNTSGSQTQLLGSATAASSSLKIVLFNQSLLSTKISLYGIKAYYNDVILKGEHLDLMRENETDPFEYNYRNGKIEGFDLIIYLSNSNNAPIGFTEFSRVQGLSRNLSIVVKIEDDLEDPMTDIVERTDLGQLKVTDLSTILIGDQDYKYTSSSKILENMVTPKHSYTVHVEDLGKGKAIVTSSGGVVESGLYHCGVLRNRNFDPHDIGFTGYSFCKNNTDFVILEWVGNKYSIYSMTLANRFGNPRAYTRDNLGINPNGEVFSLSAALTEDVYEKSAGFCEIPVYEEGLSQRIISCAGRYILVDVDGNSKIYDVIEDKFVNISGQVVLNERSFTSGLTILEPGHENFLLGCPELMNLYMDISPLFVKNLTIYRRIGSWFILQYNYKVGTDIYICASPVSSVYLTKEDLGKLIILNDNTILLKEKDYYVIYSGYSKTFYSERARNIIEGGELETLTIKPGVDILYNVRGTYDELYKGYYKEKDIEVVGKKEELYTTVFNRFRKNSYPVNIPGIPDIVGGCEGLVFYKNGKIINYL